MMKQCMAVAFALATAVPALADGKDPVTTGAVIRGVTLPGPAGAKGTDTGSRCNFDSEETDSRGKMTGASVNCKAGGTEKNVLAGLPSRFNAYCVLTAPVKGARLIPDPETKKGGGGNKNHCDLSGITPQDAQGQFGRAVWRY